MNEIISNDWYGIRWYKMDIILIHDDDIVDYHTIEVYQQMPVIH